VAGSILSIFVLQLGLVPSFGWSTTWSGWLPQQEATGRTRTSDGSDNCMCSRHFARSAHPILAVGCPRGPMPFVGRVSAGTARTNARSTH